MARGVAHLTGWQNAAWAARYAAAVQRARSAEESIDPALPLTRTAIELGSERVANIVALGALAAFTNLCDLDALAHKVSAEAPRSLVHLNLDALAANATAFVESYNKADAAALAQLFLPEGEIVLATGDTFQEIARSPLGEGTHSTPCVDGRRLYVKTFTHLVCIGSP